MINGVINVYKEPGYTSHDVVARLRGITHQKKIGHTGTLDPEAVGVLCVCMGAATRICDMLTDATKEYEAVLLLGVTTDTQDTTGEVLQRREVNITEEALREVITHYVGDIKQIPPMYSALKVNGKKLYELARAGVEVERKPRDITIYSIDVVDITLPRATIRVTCSKGTYIRTLCNDIGEELGCGAAMEHLTRTRVGDFGIETAHTLDDIEEIVKRGDDTDPAEALSEILVTPQDVFSNLKSAVVITDAGVKRADNGNILEMVDIMLESGYENDSSNMLIDGEEITVLRKDGFFYGVFKYQAKSQILKPVKMFLC